MASAPPRFDIGQHARELWLGVGVGDVVNQQRDAERSRRRSLSLERRIFMEGEGIPQDRDARDLRGRGLEQFKALARELRARIVRDPGDVAAGMREARDEAEL